MKLSVIKVSILTICKMTLMTYVEGAMTVTITRHSITILSKILLSKANDTQCNDTQHIDNLHNDTFLPLTLSQGRRRIRTLYLRIMR
jgi:hypothetical protein